MIDQSKLNKVLTEYKNDFPLGWWKHEKFKWKAVKIFQDNWDIEAEDFPEMLKRSFAGTENLLTSNMNFPKKMIINLAEEFPDKVRSMFVDLFDESKDVYERIKSFKEQSEILLNSSRSGALHHYQYENAITTYLWLCYPDKYYIYKWSEAKAVAQELNTGLEFKAGAYEDNIKNHLQIYNEICNNLKEDTELINLLNSQLTNNCYSDPELKTLTTDVGYYISRKFRKNKEETKPKKWIGTDFNPGLTTNDWLVLLHDNEIFTPESLEIVKQIKELGGIASCTELSNKFKKTVNYYNTNSVELAKRICSAKNISPNKIDDNSNEWWTILYTGRKAENNEEGSFIWKLRDELSEALDKFNQSSNEPPGKLKPINKETNYWWLNANPKVWSFNDIEVGKSQFYTLYNENGNKRRIFKNFLAAKQGDKIIGYESSPKKQVVALGKIIAENDGEKIEFEKTENLVNPINYSTLQEVPELKKMEFGSGSQGSLFKLTKDEYNTILDIIREENPVEKKILIEPYTKNDFLREVYMDEDKFEILTDLLKYKKNIILEGAPGVGKTFTAKRLAWALMGEKDESRIESIQFHQNYSYEDFVMGFKPVEDGFELKNGIFYRFCQKAANNPDKDFFFIIDEINRGNLSKIFGELLSLIENSHRNIKITMAYNDLSFSIPDNLYIIGMMNTADRSLAFIDNALRRRFSFFEMEPGFESEGFKNYKNNLENETLDRLIEKIIKLNKEIKADSSLGEGFCIGHSFFCNLDNCSKRRLMSIVDYEILPTLKEYWFDDTSKYENWKNNLQDVFK